MVVKVTVSSKVKDEKGKEYNSLASLIQIRQAIGSIRSVLVETNKELGSTYTLMGNILDEVIAAEFGATVLPSRSGRGAIFDNLEVTNEKGRLVTTGKGSETKSVKVLETAKGLQASGIEVTSGINLSTTKQLITGIKAGIEVPLSGVTNSDDYVNLTDVDFNAQLLDTLITTYNKGQPAIKKYFLSTRSPTILALKKNFELKQSDIKVSFVTSKGEVKKASIGWTWAQILSPKSRARISITKNKDNNIIFNVTFSEGMVSKALNKANKANFEKLEHVADIVAKRLASIPGISAKALDLLNKELAQIYKLSYVPGSVFAYQSNLFSKPSKKTKTATKPTKQQFITSAQWTALVQRRLGKSMSHGGAAAPPNLKWRTGNNFVDSVKINVNYRANMIQYWYNPFLDSLRAYGYQPGLQVERSIREIAREQYAREFKIVRSTTQ